MAPIRRQRAPARPGGRGKARQREPGKDSPAPAGVRLSALDELEVRIEKLVAGGDGLARYEGIPIFVARTAPGDRLRVRLVARRTDYGRAEVVEILAPGPGRRSPPCPYFERCGGCDLQHLGDGLQVRLKVAAFCETLMRLGGPAIPAPTAVVAGAAWGYRHRCQLHVGRGDRGPEVGYFARGSHELVVVDRCPVLAPEIERLLPRLPELLGDQPHRRLDLAVGDGEHWSSSPVVEGLPHGEIATRVGSLRYSYDARCFFQSHRQLVPALVEHTIGPATGDEAVDLYAGVGLFTLPLARRYHRVIAVEGDRVAARYARINARRNRLPKVRVEALSVDAWVTRRAGSLSPDRVVVDPPRGGLSPVIRRWLLKARPARLTYVSCHAATLARDLKALRRAYRLERLALLDLFPQTGHLEAVVQLAAAAGE